MRTLLSLSLISASIDAQLPFSKPATMSDSEAVDGNPVAHFEIVTRNGKNKVYRCNYCDKEFNGTGTRCYVHLTGDGTGVGRCDKVPADVVQACKAVKAKKDADASLKRKAAEDAAERKRLRASQGSSGTPTGPTSKAPSAASGQVRAMVDVEPVYKYEYCTHLDVVGKCLPNYGDLESAKVSTSQQVDCKASCSTYPQAT